jgi:hypothetical protein
MEEETEEILFCQSCGMPMLESEHFGKNKDGSINVDYCSFCFEDGEFALDTTMDEMILHCAEFVDEYNKNNEQIVTRDEAIIQMKKNFPLLKRWRMQ